MRVAFAGFEIVDGLVEQAAHGWWKVRKQLRHPRFRSLSEFYIDTETALNGALCCSQHHTQLLRRHSREALVGGMQYAQSYRFAGLDGSYARLLPFGALAASEQQEHCKGEISMDETPRH